MLLPRQHLSEPISHYLIRRDLSNCDPSRLDFLPHLVPINVDISKLGVEYYIIALNQCNSTLIIAVDSNLIG
jgi:hypothetical protein